MSLATAETIRDRSIQLIEWTDPPSLTSTRFRRYRNEGGADFRDWAEKNLAASFRRFQVRNLGNDEPPTISNTDFEERRLSLQILIAYPQTNRAGSDNALDRDDIIEQDWDYIDFNIGLCSRGNFTGTYDCTPLGCTKEIERGSVCDFMVIRAEYLYKRALAVGGLAQGVGGGP